MRFPLGKACGVAGCSGKAAGFGTVQRTRDVCPVSNSLTVSSLGHGMRLRAARSTIVLHVGLTLRSPAVPAAEGTRFTSSNARSETPGQKSDESLRDRAIANRLSWEEKGRNCAVRIKEADDYLAQGLGLVFQRETAS